MAVTYRKFESNNIKILDYGGRNKLSEVICNICTYKWNIMAKRIKSTHCPKCRIIEKMEVLEKDEFITFDKGNDINYDEDIFSYKCNVCDCKFTKSLNDISLYGPCKSSCDGEQSRAKILAEKGGCEFIEKVKEPLYYLEEDREKNPNSFRTYTTDEMIVLARKLVK